MRWTNGITKDRREGMKHGDKVQRTVYFLEFEGERTSREELSVNTTAQETNFREYHYEQHKNFGGKHEREDCQA
jgi:hypothetical protein